jgi:hypothetical protein
MEIYRTAHAISRETPLSFEGAVDRARTLLQETGTGYSAKSASRTESPPGRREMRPGSTNPKAGGCCNVLQGNP